MSLKFNFETLKVDRIDVLPYTVVVAYMVVGVNFNFETLAKCVVPVFFCIFQLTEQR